MDKDYAITITTTALAGQAELLTDTFQSFRENLKGIDWKRSGLRLHIDPQPRSRDAKSVERAARALGLGTVAIVSPPQPQGPGCFPRAINRLWRNLSPEGPDYLLHLESDWQLTRPVELATLTRPMQADPKCIGTTLRYYQTKSPLFFLLPTVWKKSFIIDIMQEPLDLSENPETQLRRKFRQINKSHGIYNVYYPQSQYKKILKDTGRVWKNKNKITKDSQGEKDFVKLKSVGR